MVLLWGYEKNRNTTLVFENNSNEKQKPPFYKTKEGVSKCTHPLFMHKAPTFSSQGFAIS